MLALVFQFSKLAKSSVYCLYIYIYLFTYLFTHQPYIYASTQCGNNICSIYSYPDVSPNMWFAGCIITIRAFDHLYFSTANAVWLGSEDLWGGEDGIWDVHSWLNMMIKINLNITIIISIMITIIVIIFILLIIVFIIITGLMAITSNSIFYSWCISITTIGFLVSILVMDSDVIFVSCFFHNVICCLSLLLLGQSWKNNWLSYVCLSKYIFWCWI